MNRINSKLPSFMKVSKTLKMNERLYHSSKSLFEIFTINVPSMGDSITEGK